MQPPPGLSMRGFREDMQPPPGLSMRAVVLLALIGGSAGAALLLITPDATFRKVVPWLLLAATALFALGPRLRQWAGATAHGPAAPWKAALGMLAVAGYGGYFNGGLGILLLALFGLLGQTQLNAMNGMKNLVSALLTAIAVAIYAAGGIVLWPQALMMMVAATAGGAQAACQRAPLGHRGYRAGDGGGVLLAAVSSGPLPSSSAPPSSPAGSSRLPPRVLWAMLLTLLSGFALSQAFRTTTAILAQGLTAEFGLSPGSLGAFAGLFGLSFGVAQLLMGVGLDLWGLRRTVLAAFPL
eukprot:gene34495-44251_t